MRTTLAGSGTVVDVDVWGCSSGTSGVSSDEGWAISAMSGAGSAAVRRVTTALAGRMQSTTRDPSDEILGCFRLTMKLADRGPLCE